MPENGSELEALKQRLYSRVSRGLGVRRHGRFGGGETETPQTWNDSQEPPESKPVMPLLKLALVSSIVFFFVALIAATYFFFDGTSVISSDRIDVTVEGPAIVDAGKPLSLAVQIENNNATPLELADLLVEYPEGTKSVADINVDLPRERQPIGTIESGESAAANIQAVLFGQESEEKTIKLSVEYRLPNSNAIFYKEKTVTVTIGSAPLAISIDAVEEISSNQRMEFRVTIASNSTSPMQNLLLRVEYPFGFSFATADTPPSYSTNLWNVGDLPPGGKRTIRFEGALAGEDNDERVFKFSVGSKSPTDDHTLGSVFMSASHRVAIRKPFVGVELALNGQSTKQVIADGGGTVRADVLWRNNLPTPVSNLTIEAKLTGSVNPNSVSVPNGFYRSSDNTIIWNAQTIPQFQSLSPGDSGNLQFSFAPPSLSQGGASLRDPSVTISVEIRANRLGEGNVPETIASAVEKKVLFASSLLLRSTPAYLNGPFTNSGPIPPKADEQTTYTILWSLSNSSNALSRVRVTTTLPPSVRFLKGDSGITFNPVGGIVTWDIGSVPAGAGFGGSSKEAAFQVAFVPSVSQIGSTPVLINQTTVTGDDQFTKTEVRGGAGATTIDIAGDPAYKQNADIVTE